MSSLSCFSHDLRYFAITGTNLDSNTLKVFDTQSGSIVSEFLSKTKFLHIKFQNALGKDLITACLEDNITLFEYKMNQETLKLKGQSNGVFVCFDKVGYSASDNNLVQWDLTNGKPKKFKNLPASTLALNLKQNVLVLGEKNIQLWDLKTQKTLKTFGSFAFNVSCIEFSDNFIFSACLEDRFVNIFDFEGKLIHSISSTSNIREIFSNLGNLMILSKDQTLTVYNLTAKKASIADLKPSSTVSLANQNKEIVPLINAKIEGKNIICCHGSFISLKFEQIKLKSGDQIIQVSEPEQEEKQKTKKRKEQIALNGKNLSISNVKSEQAQNLVQETFEEKMKALKLLTLPKEENTLQPKSLHNMLTQALHSGDSSLLESCLEKPDQELIDSTIKKLTPTLLFPFLEALLKKFELKPNRAQVLLIWIQSIILNHSAYLMTVPALNLKLEGLHQAIEKRTGNLKKLLLLAGRLDLVAMQIEMRNQVHEEQDEDDVLTFNESKNEESEEEDESEELENNDEDESDQGSEEDMDQEMDEEEDEEDEGSDQDMEEQE